jgi:O-acetyl-ADP-ribose deacetylase (regulator of RNase III)
MEFGKNIKFIQGNLFNSECQTLVNTVNCVGVMGKGIALEFKNQYPDMFEIYKGYCYDDLMAIGVLYLYRSPNKWVLNFPTKVHWKLPSKMEYIEKGLEKVLEKYKEYKITSIAFPLLGCSNGGLDREKVLPLMNEYLSKLEIPVEIYEYNP